MSLNICKENKVIKIRYQDNERSGEIAIDLTEGNVIVYQTRNIRIIFEASKQVLPTTEKTKERLKTSVSQLKHSLKKEILQLLATKEAFDPEKSLSLDDILEIAQYEKESYPTIYKLINESGGTSNAKRLLALVVATLRREGKIAKTEIENLHKKLTKYYLTQKTFKVK